MTSDARFVVHVGYPKTGTTTLQRHVFPHLEGVDYLGKFIPGYSFARPELTRDFIYLVTAAGGEWDPEPLRSALADIALEGGTKLISNEQIIHPVGADPLISAERLKSVLPDASILITLRRQEDLLRSFFRNHGAFGSYLYLHKTEGAPLTLPLQFTDWLEMNFRNPAKNLMGLLNFDYVVSVYERLFGPERVQVMLYEEMASRQDLFAKELADWLAVDEHAVIERLTGQHENPGLSAAAFQRLAKSASGVELTTHKDSLIDAPDGDPPVEVEMSAVHRNAVRNRFAASNARLNARRALGLDRHDYALA